jgi:hypothetical protein
MPPKFISYKIALMDINKTFWNNDVCEGWTLYSYGMAVASIWHLASEMLAT